MINILVVDDHPIIRYGLKQIISDEKDMVVSGEAENAAGLFRLLELNKFDILILDIGLPDINGYQALKRIKSAKPFLPVLILTGRPEYQFINVTIKEGADGFLNKNETSEHLISAIRAIVEGGFYIAPGLRERILIELKKFTENIFIESLIDIELKILYLVIGGNTNREISEILKIRISAIDAYHSVLLRKLGLANDKELMRYCILEYLPHGFSFAMNT